MIRILSLTIISLLAVSGAALAVIVQPFTSWDELTQKSPDIVIARCTATAKPDGPDGMIWTEIQVASVLKGKTKPKAAKMVSQYWPRQGDRFLMFSTYQSNELYRAYNATETYRIVPIHRHFQISKLDGKTLAEQIQLIRQSRLDDLHKESKRAIQERERLRQDLGS